MAQDSRDMSPSKHLQNRDFSGTDLEELDFSEHSITDCDFTGASLCDVTFVRSRLSDCDFTGADLSGCDFTAASLESCDFTGANLLECVFTDVTWNDCDFTDAELSECVDIEFDDDDEDRELMTVRGGIAGGISITGPASFISTHTNSRTGSVTDLGWIRLECPPLQGEFIGPSVSISGQIDAHFDTRTADFYFAGLVLRAESMGGGRIRLSFRNEDAASTGNVPEVILEADHFMEFDFGTVSNLMT